MPKPGGQSYYKKKIEAERKNCERSVKDERHFSTR